MRLIANKPCSFGGQQFYIGDEIPEELVADARMQEAMGILQEGGFLVDGTVIIPIKGETGGENDQQIAVPATPEEIRQVFSIMQMNATDGTEEIAGVRSENVLILLHAADARKTIKEAAKKRADNISSILSAPNEATGGNATIDTHAEGS